MKTNIIIRIVLFSIAIVFLLGILLAGLGLRTLTLNKSADSISVTRIEGSTNSAEADASQIRELDIEWIAGDITIVADENADHITFTEDSLTDAKYAMYYRTSGDKLTIQFCDEEILHIRFGINFNSTFSKDLTVTVPADWICESLDIDTAAANLEVRDLTIREIDFDGAAGTFDLVNCVVGDMDIDTASGDVTLSGTLDSLDFDAASASFYGELGNTPRSINMDGVSGDLDITLPEDCGFAVDTSGLSSSFHSDFATTSSGGNYVYGDGFCRISVDGVSCDVTIRKGATAHHTHTDACTSDPKSCPDNSAHHADPHHGK